MKSPVEILEEYGSKIQEFKTRQAETQKSLDATLQELKAGNFGDLTLETINRAFAGITANRKKRVNSYLTNHAKINIDDQAAEVINEFKFWKKYQDKVDIFQKELLDMIYVDNELIKTLVEMRELLEQHLSNTESTPA